MIRTFLISFKNLILKGGDNMMFVALALNIINGYMSLSEIKVKRVREKVQAQLELLVTDKKELEELLAK